MKMRRTNCRKRPYISLPNLGQEEILTKPKMETEAPEEQDIELDVFGNVEISQTEKVNTRRMKMNHINCRNRTYMPLAYLDYNLPSEKEIVEEEPEAEPEEPVEAEPEPEQDQEQEKSQIEQQETSNPITNYTNPIELLEKIHSLREDE